MFLLIFHFALIILQSFLPWYRLTDTTDVPSPALLVVRDRVIANVRRMVELVGDAARLRPHVKTHKTAQVTRLCLAAGIDKFKCATIAEAEMVAQCASNDTRVEVLLSYPPIGPAANRLAQLAAKYPQAKFQAVVDDPRQIEALSQACQRHATHLEVLVDIDNGMHRTGVAPNDDAIALYAAIEQWPGLSAGGLHVYDGHIHTTDLATRTAEVQAAFEPVAKLRRELIGHGLQVPRVVAGGSFSFVIHAARGDCEASPGTTVFWDRGYATKIPDMPFEPAIVLLTRVVSKPSAGTVCLDLGHKAVSVDQGANRFYLLDAPDARMVGQSEEHLVVETEQASSLNVGDVMYALPWHVCPTVALYDEALAVENGQIVDRWAIVARRRCLTV